MKVENEIRKGHFTVAIFGSARVKKGDPNYNLVLKLSRMIAKEGLDIVTGGGPGLMEAASKGHQLGRGNKDVHAVGLGIKLPWEQRLNPHVDFGKEFSKFSHRLDHFMMLSNAVIVAPGGIGTLLELFYTWQLVQVKHICETPIILLGDVWKDLVKWIKHDLLRKKFISKDDFKNIFIARNCTDAIRILKLVHNDFKSGKEHICENFERYK